MKHNMKKIPKRDSKLITIKNPKSPISEAYRTLRTNIQFASIDKSIKSLMVTSTGPEEGKSTTISNYAVVLAQNNYKVLLIDADLRKPTQHHFFLLLNRIGLTNVLAGTEDYTNAIQGTNLSNLFVLTSGPIPPNPAEILGSKKMEKLIQELSEHYDYILFDAPPIIAVTDAQILSQYVDGVLLVVNSGKTNKELAIRAKSLLENVKANVIGVVLNNKEINGENYYYYYYSN